MSHHKSPLSRSRMLRKFEALEDRRLLTTFNVNTTIDRAIDTSLTTLTTPFGNGGKLTLREAIYLANLDSSPQSAPVDTVVLKANSTYKITVAGADEDSDMTGDFDITRNLTITNSGTGTNPIVNANGLDRAFDMANDGIQLTLDHLTIAGGITRTAGGAIEGSTDEKLIISNSTITHNIATSPGAGLGGGIALTSGDLTIVNSSITDNTAAAGVNGFGGAIRVDGGSGNITIRNSTISGNSAYGGAGAIEDGSNGDVTVTNSRIFNNHAGNDNGGAFYLTNASSVTITNSIFSGNDSAVYGGAIFYQSAEPINITGSQFLRNTAGSDGGAIWTDGGTVNVTSSTFADNTSTAGSGGAIGNAGPLTVKGSTFTHNVAAGLGGAIAQNTAGEITINNSLFNKNVSSNSATEQGGGAIAAAGGSNVIVRSSRFAYNRANVDGGAIYAGDLDVRNASTFTHNTSITGNGGAVFTSALTAEDTAFTFNTSKADGGAVYGDNSQVGFLRCTITANVATNGEGGGFQATGPQATLQVTECTINRNVAGGDGGGFAMDGLRAFVISSTINNNKSGSDGGSMRLSTTGTNTEPYPGDLGDGSLIENCTISTNGSFDAGGGIDFEGDGDLTLINNTIAFNASTNGGGIAQTDGAGTIHIGNTIVAKNTATNDPDAYNGTATSFDDLGHNLIFADPDSLFTNPSDIIGQAPLLGQLQFNGGPTKTHALLAGSPAINAADDTLAPSTDQRGVHRPQGPHADIGSFEKS